MASENLLTKIGKQPLVRQLWSESTLHIYASNEIGDAPPSEYEVRINDMEHIERFEQTERWLTRDDFVAQCRRRIATKDMYVATIAGETGPLLGYSMAQAFAKDSHYAYVDRRIHWPDRTATTYGAYIHPSVRGQKVMRVLAKGRNRFVFEDLGMQWLAFAIQSDNIASIRSSANGPEQIIADLVMRCRFGKMTKSLARRSCFPEFTCEIV